MRSLSIYPIKYFVDRAGGINNCLKIADKLLKNKVYLYDDIYFELTAENIFETNFQTSHRINREYLFAMDYLSALLSAYKVTSSYLYREKFLEIISQFFDYYERNLFTPTKDDDLIVYAQTLMFIKSFTIITYKEPLKVQIIALLYKYAEYCYNDQNYCDDNNHGLFVDLALLHLAVIFGELPEAGKWKEHAIERVQNLFAVAFYEDGFNNEGSLGYFRLNLINYRKVVEFCEVYQISGLEILKQKLEQAEQVFFSFSHSNGSYPMIGDGKEIILSEHNDISALYPDGGICVVKTKEMYLTFKCRAAMQVHTHVDDTSITARFQSFDLALDPGQYKYDRYDPINRYLRTSGGHSGVFPLFVDSLGLKEYLDRRNASGIDKFDFNGINCYISGGYEMDGGKIKVYRDIIVKPESIEIRDSWICEKPQNMRQRFVLPKEFLEVSRFTASKQLFETNVGGYDIRYKITSEKTPIMTTMNFGVLSRQYEKYESTVLLDTVAENSKKGEIIAVITVHDKKE